MKLGDLILAAVCGLVITTAIVHINDTDTSVQPFQQEQVKK